MAESDEAVVRVGGDVSDAESALKHLASTAEETFSKLIKSFDPVMTMSVALGQGMEKLAEDSLGKLKEAVLESVERFERFGEEVEHLQLVIGGSAESVSDLSVALAGIGMSSGEYEAIAYRLSMVVERNAAGFQKYGVATKDANGATLSQQQIIQNVTAKLSEYTAGAERNRVGTEMLGRSYRMFAGLMKLTADEQERATQVAKNFGLELSEGDVEAAHEFGVSMNLMWEAVKGFGIEIGRQLAPALSSLADDIKDLLVPVFDLFRGILVIVGEIMDAIMFAVNGLVLAFNMLVIAIENVVNIFKNYMSALMGGKSITEAEIEREKQLAEKIDATTAAYVRKQTALIKHATGVDVGGEKKEGGGGGEAEEPLTMKDAEATLLKLRLAEQNGFHKMSKEAEAMYWKEILDEGRIAEGEREALMLKYVAANNAAVNEEMSAAEKMFALKRALANGNAQLELDIANKELAYAEAHGGTETERYQSALLKQVSAKRKASEEMNKIDDDEAAHKRKMAQSYIALGKSQNEELVKSGKMSQADANAAEVAGMARVTTMEIEHLQKAVEREGLTTEQRKKFIDEIAEKIAEFYAKAETYRNKEAEEQRKMDDEAIASQGKLLDIELNRVKAANAAGIKAGTTTQEKAGAQEEGGMAEAAGVKLGALNEKAQGADPVEAQKAYDEMRAIIAKFYADVEGLRQKDADEARARMDEQLSHQRAMADAQEEINSTVNKEKLATGQITAKELDSLETAAALRSVQREQQELQAKQQGMDAESNDYRKLQDQIEQLNMKRGLILAQQELKQAQQFDQTWEECDRTILDCVHDCA